MEPPPEPERIVAEDEAAQGAAEAPSMQSPAEGDAELKATPEIVPNPGASTPGQPLTEAIVAEPGFHG